tara:strand:- start:549 stop:950 length:402 start_codon:yes stop_codon:yes gene_type:complete
MRKRAAELISSSSKVERDAEKAMKDTGIPGQPRKPVKRKTTAEKFAEHKGPSLTDESLSIRDRAHLSSKHSKDPATVEMRRRGRLTKKKKRDDEVSKGMKEIEREHGRHNPEGPPKRRRKKGWHEDDDGGEWI